MTKIRSSTNYKDFIRAILAHDDLGKVTPADSIDVVVKSQGRWKSYRFSYEGETRWCSTPGQVDEMIRQPRDSGHFMRAKADVGPPGG